MKALATILLLSTSAVGQIYLDNQTGFQKNADLLRSELKKVAFTDREHSTQTLLLTCSSATVSSGTVRDERVTIATSEKKCDSMTLALLDKNGDVLWVNTRSIKGSAAQAVTPPIAWVFMKKPKPLAVQLARDFLARPAS